MTARPSAPGTLKILVVDDDLVGLAVVTASLRNAGFEVVGRSQAIGTGAAIQQHRPDFVLLDVGMPGLGGDALARLLSPVQFPASRIIFFSARDRAALDALVADCGVLGGIVKSSDSLAVVRELSALIRLAPR
ncbi:MAG: response regulator [Polyangiales bacterium]